jgi:hypothetical protein
LEVASASRFDAPAPYRFTGAWGGGCRYHLGYEVLELNETAPLYFSVTWPAMGMEPATVELVSAHSDFVARYIW